MKEGGSTQASIADLQPPRVLVINLKTAKILGIQIADRPLLMTEEGIE